MKKILSVFIIVIIIVMGYLFFGYKPSEKKEKSILMLENQYVFDNDGIVKNNGIYYLKKDLFEKYFYDLNIKNLHAYIHIKDKNLDTNEMIYEIPMAILKDSFYMPISGYEKLLNIKLIESEKRIRLCKIDRKWQEGIVIKASFLRPKKSFFSFQIGYLKEKSKVEVISNEDKWCKVLTDNGEIGYISSNSVKYEIINGRLLNEEERNYEEKNFSDFVGAWTKSGYDISNVYLKQSKISFISLIGFGISNDSDNILNQIDIEQVENSKKLGYKTYGTVDNGYKAEDTHNWIRDSKRVKEYIYQLMKYTELYDLNGLIIDFENIKYEDKHYLTYFLDSLYKESKKEGKELFMCIPINSDNENWSLVYDRNKLEKVVDSFILMGYEIRPDRDLKNTLEWIEAGINKLLEDVSNEKIILGLPLYTEFFGEGLEVGDEDRIKAYSWKNSYTRKDINETWKFDDKYMQFKSTFLFNSITYNGWVQEKEVLKKQMRLKDKYGLKGLVFWRLGYENDEFWEIVDKKNR